MVIDYRKNRHACFNLKYHLVVVTKYRHKCITPEIMNRLDEISHNIFSAWKCDILAINGESDHIHIMFESLPQVQLSKLVNNYKTVTSRLIRKEFAVYLSRYYWKPYLWNQSYLLITVGGAPIEVIKQYIENQGKKANPS